MTRTATHSFAEILVEIPFRPTTSNGTGFFIPLWRAATHLTHLLAMLNEDDIDVTHQEAIDEINEALTHLRALTFPEGISTAATASAEAIQNLTTALATEFNSWTDEDQKTNLRNTIQRYAGFIAFLDRELAGLTGSDPGSSF